MSWYDSYNRYKGFLEYIIQCENNKLYYNFKSDSDVQYYILNDDKVYNLVYKYNTITTIICLCHTSYKCDSNVLLNHLRAVQYWFCNEKLELKRKKYMQFKKMN